MALSRSGSWPAGPPLRGGPLALPFPQEAAELAAGAGRHCHAERPLALTGGGLRTGTAHLARLSPIGLTDRRAGGLEWAIPAPSRGATDGRSARSGPGQDQPAPGSCSACGPTVSHELAMVDAEPDWRELALERPAQMGCPTLVCDQPALATDGSNLILRAAESPAAPGATARAGADLAGQSAFRWAPAWRGVQPEPPPPCWA